MTPEEQLLARDVNESTALPSTAVTVDTSAYWPGFRGPDRDGIIHGVQIETDWTVSPPVELWRRLIGPGWSSFAVRGNLLYTQEQRGVDEIDCLLLQHCHRRARVETPRHVPVFWESNSGAGPRGTPTLVDGRIYSLGATGILNVLNASNGEVVWSRNAASDTDTKIPTWGFSSSPLVVGDVVIAAAAGSLIAYDLTTGSRAGSVMPAEIATAHRICCASTESFRFFY